MDKHVTPIIWHLNDRLETTNDNEIVMHWLAEYLRRSYRNENGEYIHEHRPIITYEGITAERVGINPPQQLVAISVLAEDGLVHYCIGAKSFKKFVRRHFGPDYDKVYGLNNIRYKR